MRTQTTGAIATLLVGLAFPAFSQTLGAPPKDGFPNNVYTRDPNDMFFRDARNPLTSIREPRVLTRGPLAVSPADRATFSAFLKDKNTGLLRLRPREIYDRATFHTKDVTGIRGGGAYYSFADLTHAYGHGSDLELEQGQLSVGFAGANYGILTNLGDVPLEEITVKDPRTFLLADYVAAKTEPEARDEYLRFRQGLHFNGILYQSRLPLQVNATYLLRSVIFQGSDILVAFRVVRRDPDGSAIVLWKLLKQYSTSELKLNYHR